MKSSHAATAALFSGFLLALPVQAADVGVSVHISQPGVYGRVDIGRFPQPQLVMQQPVVVIRPVVVVEAPPQPVYMWVPPGHRKNWRQYCGRYNACGVPVYFVQERWYDDHVQPRGREHERERGHDREQSYELEKKRQELRAHDREKAYERGREHKGRDDDHGDDRKGKSKEGRGQGRNGD